MLYHSPHEYMANIFISYRRDDSAGYAHAVYNELVKHISNARVFIDVDTIAPGSDFVAVLEKAVAQCDVLLALIGKRWLRNEVAGKANQKDFIQLEISTALEHGIRVIPVLVDGVTMPTEEMLPDCIRELARRNAIELSNTRFKFDLGRIVAAVSNALDVKDGLSAEEIPVPGQSKSRMVEPIVGEAGRPKRFNFSLRRRIEIIRNRRRMFRWFFCLLSILAGISLFYGASVIFRAIIGALLVLFVIRICVGFYRLWEVEWQSHHVVVINWWGGWWPWTEELWIDGECVDKRSGNLTLSATLHGKIQESDDAHDVQAYLGTVAGGTRVGCQIVIDDEVVGGDLKKRFIT
jgi:hypothetical protein